MKTPGSLRISALFVLSILVGLSIAYMDSRPGFDDAGVTVAALIVSGIVMGALESRFPWLLALGLGLWIPLRGIQRTHDYKILVVFLFPLAGVYIGMYLNRLRRAG